jgi:hypothetical protein
MVVKDSVSCTLWDDHSDRSVVNHVEFLRGHLLLAEKVDVELCVRYQGFNAFYHIFSQKMKVLFQFYFLNFLRKFLLP